MASITDGGVKFTRAAGTPRQLSLTARTALRAGSQLRAVWMHRPDTLRWIPRLWMPPVCADVSGPSRCLSLCQPRCSSTKCERGKVHQLGMQDTSSRPARFLGGVAIDRPSQVQRWLGTMWPYMRNHLGVPSKRASDPYGRPGRRARRPLATLPRVKARVADRIMNQVVSVRSQYARIRPYELCAV